VTYPFFSQGVTNGSEEKRKKFLDSRGIWTILDCREDGRNETDNERKGAKMAVIVGVILWVAAMWVYNVD